MLKEYFSIAEILELKLESFTKASRINDMALENNWLFRTSNSATKPYREYHISNFPVKVRGKIVAKL